MLVWPPGEAGTCLLLARAANPEQASRIGNQTGGRVFLFLHTDDFWRDYAALRGRGGDEWAAYQRLLACERYVPALSGARREDPPAESPPRKRDKKKKTRRP